MISSRVLKAVRFNLEDARELFQKVKMAGIYPDRITGYKLVLGELEVKSTDFIDMDSNLLSDIHTLDSIQ